MRYTADMTENAQSHRWWKLAAKICGSTLFGLVLLEVGLRITGLCPLPTAPDAAFPQLPIQEMIELAAAQAWIHQPSEVEVREADGNRPRMVVKRDWCSCREDADTAVEKPAGTYRVVVLGDSHTDGFVENADSYANVLERLLPPPADVMNCGQAVSSPYQQLWIYRTLYQRFQPDLLVVGYYAGNDLLDLMLQHDRIHLEQVGDQFVHAGPTWRPDLTREQSPFKATLFRYSAICRAAAQLRWLQVDQQRKDRSADYYDLLVQANDLYRGATWQGLNQAYYFKHHPHDWANASRMFEYVLTQFVEVAPRDGMIVVVIPTRRQFHPDQFQAAEELLQLTPEDSACDDRACDLALELCGQLRIPAIDMRPIFRSFEGELYWDSDQHINVDAHRLIAEALAKQIAQKAKP